MGRYRWIDPEPVDPSCFRLSDYPLLSSVLARRGLADPCEADAFLRPALADLSAPSLLPDLDRAVACIEAAIAERRPIAIFGDYDVDGVTSTAIVQRALASRGAEVHTYVPHRLRDGYGLHLAAVQRIAASGAGLLIALDCGTGDVEELRAARDAGLPTVVVDHHHVRDASLPVTAFVSPRRPDSRYPFPSLATAGLAYQLARALMGDDGAAPLLPLAALGTVADMVPLIGENRIIAYHGLRRFAADAPIGLQVLARDAGIQPDRVSSWHFSFVIGPRINAAGRLDDARIALDLLLTSSMDEAWRLARALGDLNRRRQRILEQMVAEAEEQIRESAGQGKPSPLLVLSRGDWHVGLVGLVASRLTDRYHRPAIVLARDGAVSRGSARSIDGFDIVAALAQCSELLLEHGGHSRAAGLTVETARLLELEERLTGMIESTFIDGIPSPVLRLDSELHPHELTLATEQLFAQLEPFGTGNPAPVFFTRGLAIRNLRASRDGKHLMFNVEGVDGTTARAVFFKAGGRFSELARLRRADVAFSFRRDVWNGQTRLSLDVLDVRPPTTPLV